MPSNINARYAVNGDDILLDTNAIIYFLEGRSRIAEHVLFAERIYFSVITEIELLSSPHLSEKDNEAVRGFLSRCLRAGLTSDVVERAIHIRRTEGLKTPDAIIAATAIVHGIPLVTADKRFGRVVDLRVITDILE